VTKPNPDNCKNCSSKYAYGCAQFITQYNTEQCSDNIPSYLQTTVIGPMWSTGVERVPAQVIVKYSIHFWSVN